MQKPIIPILVIVFSTTISGCGVFTNTLTERDRSSSISRSDTPAEKNAPRSLESLTKPPQRPQIQAPPPYATFGDNLNGDHLGGEKLADRITLSDSQDSVEIESEDDLEQLILQQPAQLPSILENEFSEDKPEGEIYTLSDQGSEQTASATPPAASQNEVAKAGDVKQPVMRFQAKPTTDPPQALPNNLNDMFSTAKPAEPVEQPADGQQDSQGVIAQVNHEEIAAADPKDKLAPAKVDDPQDPAKQDAEILKLEVPMEQEGSAENAAKPSDAPPVHNEPKPLTLEDQLSQAISALSEMLLQSDLDRKTRRHLELQKQMLLVIAGQFDENSFNVGMEEGNEKEFWRHHLAAVNEMLKAELPEHPAARAASLSRTAKTVMDRLKSASSELANVAPLVIDHMELCTQINGYGQFTPAHRQFQPGQQVLIYSEIDNYTLREQMQGTGIQYFAEMRGQYAILNADNRIVSQYEYQPVQDLARRRRNDFYMYFPVTIDRNLPPGKYRLVLTVEDLIGKKAASTTQPVEFEIMAPSSATASNGQRTIR